MMGITNGQSGNYGRRDLVESTIEKLGTTKRPEALAEIRKTQPAFPDTTFHRRVNRAIADRIVEEGGMIGRTKRGPKGKDAWLKWIGKPPDLDAELHRLFDQLREFGFDDDIHLLASHIFSPDFLLNRFAYYMDMRPEEIKESFDRVYRQRQRAIFSWPPTIVTVTIGDIVTHAKLTKINRRWFSEPRTIPA